MGSSFVGLKVEVKSEILPTFSTYRLHYVAVLLCWHDPYVPVGPVSPSL